VPMLVTKRDVRSGGLRAGGSAGAAADRAAVRSPGALRSFGGRLLVLMT
jgi:hypothetical protein